MRSGRDRLDLELEDVLKLDHVGLHPQHLGDLDDPPRPVFHAVDVDEHVECRGHMLPDGPEGKVVAGHHHHRLDPVQGIAR